MAAAHIVDLDATLIAWAMEKLGSDYTVEKVDSSLVKMIQRSVIYQSTKDWWTHRTVHEEIFDNNEKHPAIWNFSEKFTFDSKASWTLIKGLKSSRGPEMTFELEYPVEYQDESLAVTFDCAKISESSKTLENATRNEMSVSENVTIKPYNSCKVGAQVRLCKLDDVMFTSDLLLWGTVKVQGHKKNKKWTKHELSASIVDALSSMKALGLGFRVIENPEDEDIPPRQILFRIEGMCSGEQAVGTRVTMQELSTAV